MDRVSNMEINAEKQRVKIKVIGCSIRFQNVSDLQSLYDQNVLINV